MVRGKRTMLDKALGAQGSDLGLREPLFVNLLHAFYQKLVLN
jgi:hypothetical protein